jgi:hypothetical protein
MKTDGTTKHQSAATRLLGYLDSISDYLRSSKSCMQEYQQLLLTQYFFSLILSEFDQLWCCARSAEQQLFMGIQRLVRELAKNLNRLAWMPLELD